MGIKLYGDPYATCYKRVAFVLAEKDVDFETIVVSIAKKDQKSSEHLKLQPFGKVPALEDDGFIIFESRAICKYIAKKYASQGAKLIPEDGDLKGFALFEQAASIEQNYFDPPCSTYVDEKVFKRFLGLEIDEAAVAASLETLDYVLSVYDGILSKQNYLAGDYLTLADLFHVPYGAAAKEAGAREVFDKYPNVKNWFEGLEALDSWKRLGGQK